MKLAFALFALGAACSAQVLDNRTPQMSCDNGGYDSNRQRFCEIREQATAAVGRLAVDPGKNGGVTIRGGMRNDILVRTRVEAWAGSTDQARALTAQVRVDASAGQVRAFGPDSQSDSGWSVSYEIFVPQTMDLSLTAFNGGINVSDVRGRIEFDTKNGGVRLTRIGGSVKGETVNGGVTVDLAGNTWQGEQLDVQTRNGGVNLNVPANYSAHVQTGTVNGAVDSDFPIGLTVQGRVRPANLDFNIGSGGPLIRVTTTNGGVKLRKI